MNKITRNKLISLIKEEIDLHERGRGNPSKDWNIIELSNNQVYDVSNLKTPLDGTIECINPNLPSDHPDYEKKFENILFPKQLRVSPNGTVVAEFNNIVNGKKEINFFILEGENVERLPRRLLKYPPRSKVAGTTYKGPSCSLKEEGYVKRYLIYPTINNFFSRMDVSNKLNSLGLPNISAKSKFTEPITNVKRIMRYNGPEICFELNTNIDFEDVSDALNQIISYREAESRGEAPQMLISNGIKNQVRKYGGQIYKGGKWVQAQRVLSTEYFDRTPILRLFMKAVQEGKIQYSVMSEFEVMGEPNENGTTYDLYMEFRFHRTYRRFDQKINFVDVKKMKPERILDPIKVKVSKSIPENVDIKTFSFHTHSGFFNQIMNEGLEQMSQKIMNIDPNTVLPEIDASFFDLENIDFD